MSQNLLMLSFTFPPFFSIGGSVRTVKFIKYLYPLGWKPTVLTIDDRGEYNTQRKVGSDDLLTDIPDDVRIYRTSASGEVPVGLLEKGRSLRRKGFLLATVITVLGKIRGLIERWLLIPDENITWLPFAVPLARRIIMQESIDIIFATCPPHSVAIIGSILKRISGKPLVIDYRDDWIDTPWFKHKSRLRQRIERSLERWVVKRADRIILVTDWSRQAFLDRYPSQPRDKFVLISNGCDLKDFDLAAESGQDAESGYFSIVHAGILSPSADWHRNPAGFFQALSNLRIKVRRFEERVRVTFTGTLPQPYKAMVAEMALENIVCEVGHLPHTDYVRTLRQAHLLLAVNYDGFSTLIPGKIYEYWAIGGPPILLLSCRGAAATLIEKHRLGTTLDPYDVRGIEAAIWETFTKYAAGSPSRISRKGIEAYDRKTLAAQLADALSEVVRDESQSAVCCRRS